MDEDELKVKKTNIPHDLLMIHILKQAPEQPQSLSHCEKEVTDHLYKPLPL